MAKDIKPSVELPAGNGLLVLANEWYKAESGQLAIHGLGGGHNLIINGQVSAPELAIWLQYDVNDPASNSVQVNKTGLVTGGTTIAIEIDGTGAELINDGLITGTSQDAIWLTGSLETGVSTIDNTGTIKAARFGINAISKDTIELTNSGTIMGTGASYGRQDPGSSVNVDKILNTGKMIGDIYLGGNNDVYNGQSGSLKGTLYGGDGNDTVTGGKEANSLHGDAGKDRITGGLGADELSGGGDKDTFIYKSIKESIADASGRDVITDFSTADGDMLNLAKIDANSRQKGNQEFDLIDGHHFTKHAGELLFTTKGQTTILSGDTNGDGKVDFAIEFDGKFHFSDADFIL